MKALSDGCRSACRAATALTLLAFCVVAAHAQPPGFERPLRAIHISGNWGSNETVVAEWERNGGDILPLDYVRHVRSLNVDWVGISVGLEYDDSMDRTIEPAASGFSDVALRQLIREFRQHGLQVYVTLYLDGEAASASERPAQRWQLGRRARTRQFDLRTGHGIPVTRTTRSSSTTSGRPIRVKLCTTRGSHRRKASECTPWERRPTTCSGLVPKEATAGATTLGVN